MLTFKLISKTEDKVIYEYFIEGNQDDSGIVAYNFKANAFEVIKSDSYALRGYSGDRGHMYSRIRKMLKNNSFDESGMVAWH